MANHESFVVDVGANDGFFNSNSYPFIARGWKALLIEPDPNILQKAQRLHRSRSQVEFINAACSVNAGQMNLTIYEDDEGGGHSQLATITDQNRPNRSIPVHVARLETLLKQQNAPEKYGLLSIDTEGHDLQVLQGANLEIYRPQVIITENTLADEAKFALLRQHGYQLSAQLEYDTVWTTR